MMKVSLTILASAIMAFALAGFRILTPTPATNTVVINGHAYAVLHGSRSTVSRPGSRLTLITGAPVGSELVTLNGVTYHVQGTPPPPLRGSRFTILAPSLTGLHTAVVDGTTYAVRP